MVLFIHINEQVVFADTRMDPYEFYKKYGHETVFIPTTETDGEICFGTAGGSASSTDIIRYATAGWQFCIYNDKGTLVQKFLLKKDGRYLKKAAPTKEVDAVKYNLYIVSLSAILDNLNDSARATLKKSSSKVKLNACMVVVKNGIPSGSISDEGKITGKVHTAYDSICNAAGWSQATKEFLKSYYNKTIVDLYRTVSLESTKGIKSVSGSGNYLYGTSIKVRATMDKGYDFAYWIGSDYLEIPNFELTVCDDIEICAYAKPKSMELAYFMKEDDETAIFIKKYYYGGKNQLIEEMPLDYKGHRFLFWTYRDKNEYKIVKPGDVFDDELILKNKSVLELYAKWEENHYSFKYMIREKNNVISFGRNSYEGGLETPGKYVDTTSKRGVSAWYTSYKGKRFAIESGMHFSVAEVVDTLGAENENNIEFIFYPIWAGLPRINASDYYFSLNEAKKGKITEKVLARYASCIDENDGEISYGNHKNGLFVIYNFNKDKYTRLNQGGIFEETFRAKNSFGSESFCTINVHIVDSNVPSRIEVKNKKVRFIDKKYIFKNDGFLRTEEEGGLKRNSVWRTNEYLSILRVLLKNGSAS